MSNSLKLVSIGRRDLIRSQGRLDELRERAKIGSPSELRDPLLEGEVLVGWLEGKNDHKAAPSFIIGSEQDLADLLPRMLAIPGAIIPVTSSVRAWYAEDMGARSLVERSLMSGPAELGFIGLMMFEIISAQEPPPDLRLVGMERVRRTLSFVCAQATMWGWRDELLAKVAERWLEASLLTGTHVDPNFVTGLTALCSFVQSLSNIKYESQLDARVLAERIQVWVRSNEIHQLDLLSNSGLSEVVDLFRLPGREQRFDFVVRTLGELASSGVYQPLVSGFLISLIEPGSFEFEGLARRFDVRDGLVSAAYFACASILGGDAVLRRHSGFGLSVVNLGLRVGGDTVPDLSFAELRVLNSVRRPVPLAYRTKSSSSIEVELVPMVTGSFRNAARRAPVVRRDEIAIYERREELLRKRIQTALSVLEEAYSDLHTGESIKQEKESAPRRRQKK